LLKKYNAADGHSLYGKPVRFPTKCFVSKNENEYKDLLTRHMTNVYSRQQMKT